MTVKPAGGIIFIPYIIFSTKPLLTLCGYTKDENPGTVRANATGF